MGSAIIAAALKTKGVTQIIGVCRSGALKSEMHGLTSVAGYADKVKWIRGIYRSSFLQTLRILPRSGRLRWRTLSDLCVRMFDSSNDVMRQMNGDANKALAETAKGQRRLIWSISVHSGGE